MIQYFYTLSYPENSSDPIEDKESSSQPATVPEINSGPATNGVEEVTLGVVDPYGGDGFAVLDEEVNQAAAAQEANPTQPEADIDQSVATRELPLSSLNQDLQVYVLADKYSIPDLKKKAAQHFEKELENADLTIEIFDVIRDIYSLTLPQDRVLRDIVIARTYAEIQHWVTDEKFMEMTSGEGDFSADLLAYTVRENLKQYEAALATIEHPGYCSVCQATLVLKQWVSKRRNLNIRKYCAKCEPWG